MPIRTQSITAAMVITGDCIMRSSGRIWKIVGKRRTKAQGVRRICLRLDYLAGGSRRPRNDKNVSLKLSETEWLTRAMVRRCFPCYDSDCACVFDQIGAR